jgi:hypothetical protein
VEPRRSGGCQFIDALRPIIEDLLHVTPDLKGVDRAADAGAGGAKAK